MSGELDTNIERIRDIAETAVEVAQSALSTTVEKLSPRYTCMTSDCKTIGGVLVKKSDMAHLHPCPIEGDACSNWKCNSSGKCCF